MKALWKKSSLLSWMQSRKNGQLLIHAWRREYLRHKIHSTIFNFRPSSFKKNEAAPHEWHFDIIRQKIGTLPSQALSNIFLSDNRAGDILSKLLCRCISHLHELWRFCLQKCKGKQKWKMKKLWLLKEMKKWCILWHQWHFKLEYVTNALFLWKQ